MPFNMKDKPKILRTQLEEETHRRFKMLAAELKTTMAKLAERAILELMAKPVGKKK
jgi:hypothetical protein